MKFETLVVVADGGGVRAFIEKVRHGPLTEIDSWAASAPKTAPPSEAAEHGFLIRLAERIGQFFLAKGEFDKLVLIAPPRALGVLRAAIDPVAVRSIEFAEAHDRRHETAEQLRARLRDVRAPI